MGTALDYIQGSAFGFEHKTEFVRLRARRIEDPYDPDSAVDDWSSPVEVVLYGFFSSSGQSGAGEMSGEVREQVETSKTLVIDDPAADVRRGDRIRQGDKVWTVEGFPSDDMNPFTGWQPTLVVRLKERVG